MAKWNISVTRQHPENQTCVIFVHGFHGDPATTWSEFPACLASDSAMTGWDILSFGYDSSLAPSQTGIWEGDPPIQTIADSFATFAATGQASKHRALLVVAHSMGGLVVQRALLDHAALRQRVDKAICFGTPSFGLAKAWPFRLPVLKSLYRQVRDMGQGSDFITSLRTDWTAAFEPSVPFGFLAVAGTTDEFVPRSASIDGFPDRQCAVVPGNHFEIVTPANANDASVRVLADFVQGRGPVGGPWGSAALALERQEFKKVEDQLWPNRASLDRRALVDLALALDGLGKRAEAMDVLKDAKRLGTDAMGVLAGRHKRNWIRDRVEHEAAAAIGLYGGAYDMARTSQDFAQAYYHGINLAFFAFVYERNRDTSRALAGEVLEHCAKARVNEAAQDRWWRLASEGEAHLIGGTPDAAFECYRLGLEGPPKPRPWQVTSTSSQALRIADELDDERVAQGLVELFGSYSS